MKKLNVSFAVILLMCTAFVSASDMKPKKMYSKVYSELSTLLIPETAVGELEYETIVRVKFRINSNNEIIVMGTDSSIENLNEYILNRLSFKKLTTDELSINTVYVFDVNFES